jgi:hypothetical protein
LLFPPKGEINENVAHPDLSGCDFVFNLTHPRNEFGAFINTRDNVKKLFNSLLYIIHCTL